MPPTSLPAISEARTALIKLPVSPHEKRLLTASAAAEGRSVAEFIRLRLADASPTPRRSDPLAGVEPLSVAITMRDEAA